MCVFEISDCVDPIDEFDKMIIDIQYLIEIIDTNQIDVSVYLMPIG